LRKHGVKPTGDEIAEADIEAAWEATASLKLGAAPVRVSSNGDSGARTVAWHEAPD